MEKSLLRSLNQHLVTAIFLIVFGLTASAQSLTPYQFLRVNSSARAAALGGAVVSIYGDPNMVFFNPAAIGTVDTAAVSFTFLKHVLDINSGLASYVSPIGVDESWGASVIYASYGTFSQFNNQATQTGTFSVTDIAVQGSYSNILDKNFRYGATAKLIYSNLASARSVAFAVDAGLIYSMPQSRTNLGFSILNAGTQLNSYGEESENLPLDIRLGINHRLRGLPLLVNFSVAHLADENQTFGERITNFEIGGELYLSKVIELRLGYDNYLRRATRFESSSQFAGLSAGLGVKIKDFNIDYAMTSAGAPATFHRISLNVKL